ncbi:MAG: VPLPA-CTERM sorting domain-containing protein [Desulfobaccales bacterium]
MRNLLKIFAVLMLLLGLMGTAQAATSILYFSDATVGTDHMAGALAALGPGYSVTTVASSSAFATDISSGTYNLGIFMVQGSLSTDYNDGITALGAFVAGGGRAIYTDWSENNTYAALFGATWTGTANESSFNVSGPLATGITNPVVLSNPGWGTFSMGVTGATVPATFPSTNGAIAIGDNGDAITNGFLTDTITPGATGVQLYTNEIDYLTTTPTVPVPGAAWLLGSGLLCLTGWRRFRKI